MVEDGYHVVFKCPAYDDIRSSRRSWEQILEQADGNLKKFVSSEDQYKVAHMLFSIMKRRRELIVEGRVPAIHPVSPLVRINPTLDLFEDDEL